MKPECGTSKVIMHKCVCAHVCVCVWQCVCVCICVGPCIHVYCICSGAEQCTGLTLMSAYFNVCYLWLTKHKENAILKLWQLWKHGLRRRYLTISITVDLNMYWIQKWSETKPMQNQIFIFVIIRKLIME